MHLVAFEESPYVQDVTEVINNNVHPYVGYGHFVNRITSRDYVLRYWLKVPFESEPAPTGPDQEIRPSKWQHSQVILRQELNCKAVIAKIEVVVDVVVEAETAAQ